MKTVFAIFGLAVAIATGAMAGGPPTATESIVYRVRYITAFCTGKCPNFELSVSPAGAVVEKRFDYTETPIVFQLTPRELADFRRELVSIRPAGTRQFDRACDVGREKVMVVHGLAEYEIRWTGGEAESRLLGCFGDAPVEVATKRALLAIRVAPTNGNRLTAENVQPRLICWRRTDLTAEQLRRVCL